MVSLPVWYTPEGEGGLYGTHLRGGWSLSICTTHLTGGWSLHQYGWLRLAVPVADEAALSLEIVMLQSPHLHIYPVQGILQLDLLLLVGPQQHLTMEIFARQKHLNCNLNIYMYVCYFTN